jgi:hypothetical protein
VVAAGVGLLNGIANLIGALAPVLIGIIITQTGSFDSGLMVLVAALLMAAICLFSLATDAHAVGATAPGSGFTELPVNGGSKSCFVQSTAHATACQLAVDNHTRHPLNAILLGLSGDIGALHVGRFDGARA